jgi:hypothetical protein
MRRKSVVATAALIAALALVGLPGPAWSRGTSAIRELAPAAFTSVTLNANALALDAPGVSGDAPDTEASPLEVAAEAPYVEFGVAPSAPVTRPAVDQPESAAGKDWKPGRKTLKGFASFYDAGTTAMRLPRGTLVRICGKGGCITRTITDYGPATGSGRIVDMYRPDFFRICGCSSVSGTTKVTISVY